MTPCFGQDVLVPSEGDAVTGDAVLSTDAGAPVADVTDAAEPQVRLSDKLIQMTDALVLAVAAKEGDCAAMRDAFVAQLNEQREFMASLDYATEQADDAVIAHVHDNAVKLGTLLSQCYDDKSIEYHLLNAMKRD